jgi:hypothetical protein
LLAIKELVQSRRLISYGKQGLRVDGANLRQQSGLFASLDFSAGFATPLSNGKECG